MFEIVLKFLADPIFFAGFSVVIGVAYVGVWIISLKEIVKPSPQSLFQAVHEYDAREQRPTASSPRRRNDKIRVKRKFPSEKASPRGRRAARAA